MEENHRFTNDMIAEAVAHQLGIAKSEIEKRIHVKSFSVTEGSKKGDNFSCVVKAVSSEVEVDGKTDTFNFMGKCVPMNPMREKWVVEGKIFDKEVEAYSVVIPELKKLQKGEIDLAFPTCHYASNMDMLMENLKTRGFQMVDKTVGLDKQHIELLIDQLSMLHAVSYHWIKTFPCEENSLRELYPLFFHEDGWVRHGNDQNKIQFDAMVGNLFNGSTAIVENFAKDRPELGAKMRTFSKVLIKEMDSFAKPKDNQFNSLLHGDYWNNNFLFLYDDEGNLKSVKILDFQLMRYGCVCQDLVYLLCTSTTPDIRKKHLGELKNYYHSRLIKHLSTFNYPSTVYPLESFEKDFNECYLFGYITASFFAQIILNKKSSESGGSMDMDDSRTGDEMVEKMKNIEKIILKEAEDNVPLQRRLVQLTEEAIDLGLI